MNTYNLAQEGDNCLVITPSGTEASVFSSLRAAVNALHMLRAGANPDMWIWHPYGERTTLRATKRLDPQTMDFEHGKTYWLTYKDGSRIKVEACAVAPDDVDLKNDLLDFVLCTGGPGDPQNREGIAWVREMEK